MKVRNTTQGYVSFTARMNPNEKARGVDAHGNQIVKEARPDIRTTVVPPMATVEIEDDVWRKATKAVAKRQGIRLEKDPVQIGTDRKDATPTHFMTTVMGDGVFKSYNPVLDLVKQGVLEIVEQPQLDLTLDEMRAAIEKAQGYPMPKEVAEELVIAQYHRICE